MRTWGYVCWAKDGWRPLNNSHMMCSDDKTVPCHMSLNFYFLWWRSPRESPRTDSFEERVHQASVLEQSCDRLCWAQEVDTEIHILRLIMPEKMLSTAGAIISGVDQTFLVHYVEFWGSVSSDVHVQKFNQSIFGYLEQFGQFVKIPTC